MQHTTSTYGSRGLMNSFLSRALPHVTIGNSRLNFRIALLVSILCLGSASLAFGFSPTLILSTTSGPPTSGLQVSGSGLAANDLFNIEFDGSVVGQASSNGSGTFSGFALQVPATALPGVHTVSAVPQDGIGGNATASFRVQTDWPQFGFNAQGTRNNTFENVLSPSNVGSLALRWSFKPGETGFFELRQPALANGVLYIGGTDKTILYALNARTGAQVWSFTAACCGLINTPAVQSGVVYMVDIGGDAWALDATTAAVLWTEPYGSTVGASPTLANGRLYYGSEADNGHNFNRGLDIQSGFGWASQSGAVGSTAAVFNNGVFAGAGGAGADGGISAMNANTGDVVWQRSLSPAQQVGSATVFANGIVYLGDSLGNVNAFDARTGNTVWQFTAGGSVLGGVALAKGVVYVGSQDKNVYALNASTGAKLWSFAASASVFYSPVIANGVLYVESIDTTYALNAKTGALLWSYPIGGNNLIVANGFLYAEDSAGTLYAFGLQP